MGFSGTRRTATRVKGGRTQKKNNWRPDPSNYFAIRQDEVRIERRSPGPGFRHLINVAQLRAFLELLPDWEEVAIGLEAIVLDDGSDWSMGWCVQGIVAVCPWEQELWWEEGDRDFEREHGSLLDLLGVERCVGGSRLQVCWTEEQARAFQLLHILPHELGHHHDRMTTRSRREAARGEPYAERYAGRVLDTVWDAYVAHFGLP